MDSYPSFTYSPHQSYFCLCICSSPWHADVSVCFFRCAEHSKVHDAQAPLPYLFLLPSHNFTLLCISARFTGSFWPHRISTSTLFSYLFFCLTPLSFSPFFSLHILVPLSTVCAVHFSLHLFCPVIAVLQGSARQLTKKTVRSMIITLPFYTLSTYSVMSAASFFLYLMRSFLLKNMSHTCE